jgi:hypothetical protein
MKIQTVEGEIRWSLGYIDGRAYDSHHKFPAITFVSLKGGLWAVSHMCDPKYRELYPLTYTDQEVEIILAEHPEGTVATRYGRGAGGAIEIRSYGGTEVFRYYPNGVVWRDIRDCDNPISSQGVIAHSEEEAIKYLFDRYKHGGQVMNEITGAFYMVYSPSGSTPPKVKYPQPDAAIAEAERLAKANPGQQFYVMQALSVSQSQAVVQTEQLK